MERKLLKPISECRCNSAGRVCLFQCTAESKAWESSWMPFGRVRTPPHIFAARARTPWAIWGADSKGNGALQTNESGCRPAGDAGWQFLLKFIKDARVVRPSADRAPPWRSREGGPSPFREELLLKVYRWKMSEIFKVRWNNNFLFWHYSSFCTRMKTFSRFLDS